MTGFGVCLDSEDDLRRLVGPPSERSLRKEQDRLDQHSRAFIALSPFLLIGTTDRSGRCDVSPKGDAPGFVHVLDERRLLIPDRPGNKRFDGMRNVLDNPRVGLLFLVPGRIETLRVNGRARITREPALLQRVEAQGRVPLLAIGVEIEQVFLHCGKAALRSRLWTPQTWAPDDALPSLACMLHDQIKPEGESLADYERDIDEANRNRLY